MKLRCAYIWFVISLLHNVLLSHLILKIGFDQLRLWSLSDSLVLINKMLGFEMLTLLFILSFEMTDLFSLVEILIRICIFNVMFFLNLAVILVRLTYVLSQIAKRLWSQRRKIWLIRLVLNLAILILIPQKLLLTLERKCISLRRS